MVTRRDVHRLDVSKATPRAALFSSLARTDPSPSWAARQRGRKAENRAVAEMLVASFMEETLRAQPAGVQLYLNGCAALGVELLAVAVIVPLSQWLPSYVAASSPASRQNHLHRFPP